MGIDDVAGVRPTQQRTYFMGLATGEGGDLASPQESMQLRLPGRSAHLRHHRRSRDRCDAELEAGSMISPNVTVAPISSDENAGVIDDAHADRGRLDPVSSSATR